MIKDNTLVNSIEKINDKFLLISNQTPFYGEAGGQLGDIGFINTANCRIKVIDTLKYIGGIIAHVCILETGEGIKTGDNADFTINVQYRQNLKIHHSATHILHAVLHQILGKHVTQKGSLVAHDRLRFDISHMSSLTQEQIILIEEQVNNIIRENSKVTTTLMSTQDAIQAGAVALFGEKYDFEVRVVSMGSNLINGKAYSLELCGGTHVTRTGDIGVFKITSEYAIAAGVRRIEAICGEFVLKLMRNNEAIIDNLSSILKTSRDEVSDKVKELVSSKKELTEEVMALQIAMLDLDEKQITQDSIDISGVKFIYKLVKNIDNKILRLSAEQISNKCSDLVIVYINKAGKLSVTVAVSKEITNKVHAGNFATSISIFLGGAGGGGKANIAQAGGVDTSKISLLPEKIKDLLIDLINVSLG